MAAPRGMVDCGAEKLTRSFDFDRTGELGFQCRFQFLQDNQTHTCGRMAWKSKRSSQVFVSYEKLQLKIQGFLREILLLHRQNWGSLLF
uniref:Uncharacterized protein n=1 Tax=Physcomitrium patens TaxID=3218 RepID=A0A2K1KFY4_PHYPA|nr:hypothetical protein PHYPA_009043 [Physcomitrium patens]